MRYLLLLEKTNIICDNMPMLFVFVYVLIHIIQLVCTKYISNKYVSNILYWKTWQQNDVSQMNLTPEWCQWNVRVSGWHQNDVSEIWGYQWSD